MEGVPQRLEAGMVVAPFWAFTTETHGVPMVAKLVKKDYATELLIEFYDLRYPFTPIFTHPTGEALRGQFISRYHASIIMEHMGGLCLDGGVQTWDIDSENIDALINWMDEAVARRQELYGDAP